MAIFLSTIACFFIQKMAMKHELQPADLEIGKINFEENKEHLTQKEIQRDIDYLIYAFDNAYAGKLVFPETYDTIINELKALVTTKDGLLKSTFTAQVQKILAKAPDNHLTASSLDIDPINLDTKERKPSAAREYNSHTSIINGKTVYVATIPTFQLDPKYEGKALARDLEDNLDNSDAIILDLRGNTGGYISLPLELASILWGERYRERSYIQYFPTPIHKSGQLNNPVILAMLKNQNVLNNTRQCQRISAENRKSFLEKIMTYNEYEYGGTVKKIIFDEYAFHATSEVEENTQSYENLHLKDRGFNKPIYLLIDNNCASACERLIESLESHPYAKTIGQNSNGSVQFGGMATVVLPESHIEVNVATSYTIYKDRRNIEKIGYKPTITLSEQEDAFTKAVRLIK